jgi:peptidoglycan/LPS O-acetylase OafA/YrhL
LYPFNIYAAVPPDDRPLSFRIAAYSLYLSHTIVLSAVGQLWRGFPPDLFPGAFLVFACTAVASTVAAGSLIYLFVEVAMLRLGRLRILRV